MAEIDLKLPAALIAAFRGKKLLIVCGAGISVAAPSSLPTWWGFNNALFEGLRAAAATALPELADVISARDFEGRMAVSTFSDLVVSTFAGSGYFPLLTALEGARPNANHRAMATLAREGVVSDIITFNFDTLIEQAFRAEKTPLRVLVRPEDYDRPRGHTGEVRLHKVHGSVTDAASLIDTVTQKLKGLAVARRTRVRDLFSRRHVLFLGFSGADFDFGSDYLPMSANAGGGHGFTWLFRDKEPEVAPRFIDPAGSFVRGELPAFLGPLGIEIEPPPTGPSGSTAAQTLAERVRAWISEPSVGPWSSAAFMLAFAEKQQDLGLADALCAALETVVRDALVAGHPDLTMSGCARRIALHAMQQGDFNRALAWSAQELQFHEAMWKLLTEDPAIEIHPETRLEHLRNTASVYVNMAQALLHGSDPDRLERAKTLLLRANGLARDARDQSLLALIQFNLVNNFEALPDERLMDLRATRAAAHETGAGRTLVESAFIECQILIDLSELDLAEAVAHTIRPLIKVAGEAGEIWEVALRLAIIAVRRGNFEAAMAACESVGKNDPAGDSKHRSLARRIRQLFASRPELGARLSAVLADLGDTAPLVEATLPQFRLVASGDDQEDDLRRTIAAAEFHQRHDVLPQGFEQLARLQHGRRAWARLADTAFALERAAERAGAHDALLAGYQYRGIATEMLGAFDMAAAAFGQAVEHCASQALCAGTQRANLAGVLWRLGELDRAQTLYGQAQDELHAAGDWRQLAVATISFGRKLVDAGRGAEAAQMVRATMARPGMAAETDLCAAMVPMAQLWADGGREPTEGPIRVDPGDLDAVRARAKTAEALGNLAIAEIEAGETDTALDHIEAARRLYQEAGDRLGEARCDGNLAQLHAQMKAWDAAVLAQRRSVALRDAVGDPEQLLLAESNLAAYLLEAGAAEEALEVSRQAMRRAPAGSASWAYTVAARANVFAACKLGRLSEAREAIPSAIAALRTQHRSERERLIEELRQTAAEIDEELAEVSPRIELSLAASARLAGKQGFSDANALSRDLQAAAAEPGWSDVERATFLGEAGNRFFAGGQRQTAFLLYRDSAAAYDTIAHPMAWHARRNLASGLLTSGDATGAQAVLAELLDSCPVIKVRLDALITLARFVLTHQSTDEAALARVRDQMLVEWARPTTTPETSGRMGLMLCQVQAAVDGIEPARATLQRAKALLVSCNSDVLPAAAEIEAALLEA